MDQGKYCLCEVTCCFAYTHAAGQSQCKRELEKQIIHLCQARASQVRSRCRRAEEGETSSSFFLNLGQKYRAKQSVTSIPDPVTGTIHGVTLGVMFFSVACVI